MTRLIDADALCEEFKERQKAALRWKEKAILDGDEERQIRADATLAFLSEVKLTIDNAPTVEERPQFVHVIINHPRYGECDGWLDKSRQLLFIDTITTEAADKLGWTWKEDGNDKV